MTSSLGITEHSTALLSHSVALWCTSSTSVALAFHLHFTFLVLLPLLSSCIAVPNPFPFCLLPSVSASAFLLSSPPLHSSSLPSILIVSDLSSSLFLFSSYTPSSAPSLPLTAHPHDLSLLSSTPTTCRLPRVPPAFNASLTDSNSAVTSLDRPGSLFASILTPVLFLQTLSRSNIDVSSQRLDSGLHSCTYCTALLVHGKCPAASRSSHRELLNTKNRGRLTEGPASPPLLSASPSASPSPSTSSSPRPCILHFHIHLHLPHRHSHRFASHPFVLHGSLLSPSEHNPFMQSTCTLLVYAAACVCYFCCSQT